MTTRDTKREDRRALVEAGNRYHAAKLAFCYAADGTDHDVCERKYDEARDAIVHLAECYAVGRRKASTEYGIAHYAKQKAKA